MNKPRGSGAGAACRRLANRNNVFGKASALFLWHNRRKEKREILIGQTRIKAVPTDRENGLCELCLSVGTGVLDGPEIESTKYGPIADKYIHQLHDFYEDLSV